MVAKRGTRGSSTPKPPVVDEFDDDTAEVVNETDAVGPETDLDAVQAHLNRARELLAVAQEKSGHERLTYINEANVNANIALVEAMRR